MRYLVLAFALAIAGCGGDDGVDMAVEGDMAQPAGPDMTSPLCMDPRADEWALPLTKTSTNGLFKVTLAAGNPDPPTTGINTWTLDVTDANGTPLSNVTFMGDCHGTMEAACPWMPDHGHGTGVKPAVTAGSTAGSYTVTPLYLFMAGVWQVTFTMAMPGSSTTDQVTFTYCLADLMGS